MQTKQVIEILFALASSRRELAEALRNGDPTLVSASAAMRAALLDDQAIALDIAIETMQAAA